MMKSFPRHVRPFSVGSEWLLQLFLNCIFWPYSNEHPEPTESQKHNLQATRQYLFHIICATRSIETFLNYSEHGLLLIDSYSNAIWVPKPSSLRVSIPPPLYGTSFVTPLLVSILRYSFPKHRNASPVPVSSTFPGIHEPTSTFPVS